MNTPLGDSALLPPHSHRPPIAENGAREADFNVELLPFGVSLRAGIPAATFIVPVTLARYGFKEIIVRANGGPGITCQALAYNSAGTFVHASTPVVVPGTLSLTTAGGRGTTIIRCTFAAGTTARLVALDYVQ